jgi:hypothetical protein
VRILYQIGIAREKMGYYVVSGGISSNQVEFTVIPWSSAKGNCSEHWCICATPTGKEDKEEEGKGGKSVESCKWVVYQTHVHLYIISIQKKMIRQ